MVVNVYLEDWSNGMKDSPEYVFRLMDALKPVSYTHLDVYKRQVIRCFCMERTSLKG